MDFHELEKMTVTNLRDEAKKIGTKGVTSMKKEELVNLLADHLGIEKPHKVPKKTKHHYERDKKTIKAMIVELREQQKKARSEADKKRARIIRRRLHLLKRQTRKAS